jgi:hypothetical protein
MRRTLTWLLALPFAAASVLLGHGIAYRVTGTPAGDIHGYLAHAPQIVLVLATLALVGLAVDSRARRASPLPLASLAVLAFVTQEHLERAVHTGQVPFLLTSPVLWIGIVLQLPLAAAIWVVARRIAADIATTGRRGAPRILPLFLPVATVDRHLPGRRRAAANGARGPPVLS